MFYLTPYFNLCAFVSTYGIHISYVVGVNADAATNMRVNTWRECLRKTVRMLRSSEGILTCQILTSKKRQKYFWKQHSLYRLLISPLISTLCRFVTVSKRKSNITIKYRSLRKDYLKDFYVINWFSINNLSLKTAGPQITAQSVFFTCFTISELLGSGFTIIMHEDRT